MPSKEKGRAREMKQQLKGLRQQTQSQDSAASADKAEIFTLFMLI